MYIFISVNVHMMYMRRPSIPEDIWQTVNDEARAYENSWRETLERILEQDAKLEIKSIEAPKA